jgi:hypothetical protein
MVSVLAIHGHGLRKKAEGFWWAAGLGSDSGFAALTRCGMSYQEVSYPDFNGDHHYDWSTQIAMVSIDFSKVDPLAIKVSYDNTYQTWDVMMSGTNEGPVGDWKGVARDHSYNPAVGPQFKIKPELLELSCAPNEKHCRPVSGPYISAREYFDDQEVAKRFARAAFHASILCGGTKAVSPF